MKFRCERDVLAEALAATSRAATGRSGAHPVLSGVRLVLEGSQLELTGSDRELTIQTTIGVDGDRDGTAVLPARLVADIVRSLDAGAVTVEVKDDEAHISANRSQFTVRPFDADDYPRLGMPAEHGVTLPAAALGDALRQVVRAASADETRVALTGVLFAAEEGGLRLVATDSYRLAIRDLPGTTVLGADQKVLVPSRALKELERLLPAEGEVTLRLGERQATFEVASSRLTTTLIENEFPNYRPLIPASYPNRLTVSKDALTDAIRRVKLLAAKDGTPIRLAMGTDGLELTAVAQDVGNASEAVDAAHSGADMTVAFNPDYLSSGVDAVLGDEVVIETLDALKPAVVRAPGQEEFLYLLMPVRVP